VSIRLPEGEVTVDVLIDGRQVRARYIGRPVRVAPGTHEVTVQSVGRKPFRRTITVGPGASATVDVVLDPIDLSIKSPPDDRRVPPAPRDDDPGVLTRWWFWTGAGVVVVAAAVTTFVLLSSPDALEIPMSDLGVVEPTF
jgi:hypothetical protein